MRWKIRWSTISSRGGRQGYRCGDRAEPRGPRSTAIGPRTRSIPTVIRSGPIASLSAARTGRPWHRPRPHGHPRALWRQPILRHELEERLDQAHRPYHRAIERDARAPARRVRLRACCWTAIRCPRQTAGLRSSSATGTARAPRPGSPSEAVKIVTSVGFRVGVNQPFAGGHVVQRHGAPARGVHALQIEIDRRCYLQAQHHEAGAGICESRAAVRGAGRSGSASRCSTAVFPRLPNKKGRPGHARGGPVQGGNAPAGALLAAANEGSYAAADSPQDGCAAAGFNSTRRVRFTLRRAPAAASRSGPSPAQPAARRCRGSATARRGARR